MQIPSNCGMMEKTRETEAAALEEKREIVYKRAGGRDLSLQFRPAGSGGGDPAPLLILITGGGWASCVKEDILWFTSPVLEDALAAWFAAASPEYRLCHETDMRGIVSDCMDAARYFAVHGEELGVDPGRICFCGHSAGAHLALMAALADPGAFIEDSPFPGARYRTAGCAGFATPAVLFDGPEGPAPTDRAILEKVLGEKMESDAYRREMSPVTHINRGSPPLYLIHGDSDPTVYYENALRVQKACGGAGVPFELLTVSGGGHSFETVSPDRPASPGAAEAYGTVIGFWRRCLTEGTRR